jgi:hypothetical protein
VIDFRGGVRCLRPLLHGDVSSAARALLLVPLADRDAHCRKMIAQAQIAYLHMQSTDRIHPQWGNGSLMSAARRHPLPQEPNFDERDYRHCWQVVLAALDHQQQT